MLREREKSSEKEENEGWGGLEGRAKKKTLKAKRKLHVALMNRREAGRGIRVGGRSRKQWKE